MLIVDVAFTLFFGGPAFFVILAISVRTLPRTLVTLHVFRTVARTAEDLVASVEATVVRLDRFALSTTCHGPLHVIIQRVSHDGTLRRRHGVVCTSRKDGTIKQRNVFACFVADELEGRVVSHIVGSSPEVAAPQLQAFITESYVSANSKFGIPAKLTK